MSVLTYFGGGEIRSPGYDVHEAQPPRASPADDARSASTRCAGELREQGLLERDGDRAGARGRSYRAHLLSALPDEGSRALSGLRHPSGVALRSARAATPVGVTLRSGTGQRRDLPARARGRAP